MKVQIFKVSGLNYWYKDMIGQVIEVEDIASPTMKYWHKVLDGSGRYIHQKDVRRNIHNRNNANGN